MNIMSEFMYYVVYSILVFYPLAGISLRYHIHKYGVTQQQVSQFVENLTLPSFVTQKLKVSPFLNVKSHELKYSKFVRITWGLIGMFLIVPLDFHSRIFGDQGIIYTCVGIIYAASFIGAWRFGHRLSTFSFKE